MKISKYISLPLICFLLLFSLPACDDEEGDGGTGASGAAVVVAETGGSLTTLRRDANQLAGAQLRLQKILELVAVTLNQGQTAISGHITSPYWGTANGSLTEIANTDDYVINVTVSGYGNITRTFKGVLNVTKNTTTGVWNFVDIGAGFEVTSYKSDAAGASASGSRYSTVGTVTTWYPYTYIVDPTKIYEVYSQFNFSVTLDNASAVTKTEISSLRILTSTGYAYDIKTVTPISATVSTTTGVGSNNGYVVFQGDGYYKLHMVYGSGAIGSLTAAVDSLWFGENIDNVANVNYSPYPANLNTVKDAFSYFYTITPDIKVRDQLTRYFKE